MKTIKQTSINSRLDTRLAAYAAAGAAIAAPVLSPSAEAAVVYSGPVSISIPVTSAGVYLNVVTGVSNVAPASAPGWDVNPFSSTTLSFFNPTAPTGGVYVVNYPGGSSATLPDNLPFGTAISALNGYGSGTGESTGATAFVLNSSSNYVGFRFTEATLNGGAVTYGWLQIQLGATLTDPARAIVGYAYENTGAAIGAGQTSAVPEPTTNAVLGLGALALGAVAVRRMRKSKQAVA